MTKRGVKLLDPLQENAQIDWLVVSAVECRSEQDEYRWINRHFRKPHEPWGHSQAFVAPVNVRRSRNRVLFLQQSGLK